MSELTEKIAAGIPSWGAKLAYGPKTVVDGVELVPVALVAFGFGAGELSRPNTDGLSSEGGGGSGVAFPIGVYVREDGAARFKPNVVAVAFAAAPVIAAIGVAISSIILAGRKR